MSNPINPFFCPMCEPLRGVEKKTMLVNYESFYYKSFGMCTECYFFEKTAPQQVIDENRNAYEEKQALIQENKIREKQDKIYRVYFVDSSESFSKVSFVNQIVFPHKFSQVFLTRTNSNTEKESNLIHKSQLKMSFDDAEKVCKELDEHNIECWFETDFEISHI